MRATRMRVVCGFLLLIALAVSTLWVLAKYERHQKLLVDRRLYAELYVEHPPLALPREIAAADTRRMEPSVTDLARSIERRISNPFVANRALRDVPIKRTSDEKRIDVDEITAMIRTTVEVHESWATVRVWLEGDLRPADAASVANALARAAATGHADEWLDANRKMSSDLKAAFAKEVAKRAALLDQIQAMNRRIQAGNSAARNRKVKSRELLVSKLDETLADLMGQRVLLLADQSAADNEAWASFEKGATTSAEETQAEEKTGHPSSESALTGAFKRRLEKLDRKIEFIKRSLEELDVESTSMTTLETDLGQLQEELGGVSARAKSLDDAIWLCEWKLEHMPATVTVSREAEAGSRSGNEEPWNGLSALTSDN